MHHPPTFEDQVAADKARLEALVARLPAGRRRTSCAERSGNLRRHGTSAIGFRRRVFNRPRIENRSKLIHHRLRNARKKTAPALRGSAVRDPGHRLRRDNKPGSL